MVGVFQHQLHRLLGNSVCLKGLGVGVPEVVQRVVDLCLALIRKFQRKLAVLLFYCHILLAIFQRLVLDPGFCVLAVDFLRLDHIIVRSVQLRILGLQRADCLRISGVCKVDVYACLYLHSIDGHRIGSIAAARSKGANHCSGHQSSHDFFPF